MTIVKTPKNFINVLNTLRSGNIDLGLQQLENIQNFEPQKNIVKAEINYFKNHYEEAMYFDEQALPFDTQWYAGNILTEHLFAYSNSAILSNNEERAKQFLNNYLAKKETLNLPEHRINLYRRQISEHLKKLDGEKNLIIDKKPLKIIEHGKSKTEFVAQLKEFRPKLTYNSPEGAEYLLYFMFEEDNSQEALDYYSQYCDQITNSEHHINASRLYLQTNQINKAKQAIMRFVTKTWCPAEYIQITPMALWLYEDLYPILTPTFKEKILYTPKVKLS